MDVLACSSVGHFIPHQINEICNVNVKGSFESDVKNLENLRIEEFLQANPVGDCFCVDDIETGIMFCRISCFLFRNITIQNPTVKLRQYP